MYAKIFQKIFDSSIADDWQQRVVFQDMLILCNRDGIIDMTHEAISRRTNVPIEIVCESIRKLESPDPKSNTPDEDGRRLERLDEHREWGWKIINFPKYRDIKNSEEMRAATRERVKRWRERKKNGDKPREVEKPVISARPTVEQCVAMALELGMGRHDGEAFFDHYCSNGWKVGRNSMKDVKATMRGWKRRSKIYNNGASDGGGGTLDLSPESLKKILEDAKQ